MNTLRSRYLKTGLVTGLVTWTLGLLISCTSYTLDENKSQYVTLKKETINHNNTTKENKSSQDLITQYAPLIKIFDANENFNKIGTPKANNDGSVYVDGQEPSFYTSEQIFKIENREYTNLIYRIHFNEIPFSIVPFHLSKGENVGLIFVVTLNEHQEPILFTTVHSCGCYKALMATTFTPKSFYPKAWSEQQVSNEEKQKIYGEKLPTIIPLNEKKPDICVAIRPQEHRVMDVYACDKTQTNLVEAPHYSLASLRTLASDNGPVSFFHESGFQEGFVKGAIKPWESLMLSWPSMDFFVGTDKALLRTENSNNTFYTSLKPWNRDKTDMANFPQFLNYWGWNL